MNIITKFHLFEKKESQKEFEPSKEVQKEVDRFMKKWEIKLDPHFTIKEILQQIRFLCFQIITQGH